MSYTLTLIDCSTSSTVLPSHGPKWIQHPNMGIENSRVALRSGPCASCGSHQGCLKVGLPGSVAFTMGSPWCSNFPPARNDKNVPDNNMSGKPARHSFIQKNRNQFDEGRPLVPPFEFQPHRQTLHLAHDNLRQMQSLATGASTACCAVHAPTSKKTATMKSRR